MKKYLQHLKHARVIHAVGCCLSVIAALTAAAYFGYSLTNNYRLHIEYAYQNALSQLGGYIDDARQLLQHTK